MAEPLKLDESERIIAWRADRAKAAEDGRHERLRLADADREARLAAYEAGRDRRVEQARLKREADLAEAEAGRLQAARDRLAGLEDLSLSEHALRRRRRTELRLALLRIGTFVGLPVLAASLYAAYVATPVFTSRTEFTVSAAPGANAATLATPGDILLSERVRDYVRSPRLARDLPGAAAFVAQFAGPDVDPLQRARPLPWLGIDAGDLLQQHIVINSSQSTGQLVLLVDGRSAAAAQSAAWQILEAVESNVAGTPPAGGMLRHIALAMPPDAPSAVDKSKYTKAIALTFIASALIYTMFTIMWTNVTYYSRR